MHNSNLRFQLGYELRYWRNQSAKLIFLLGCFSLLCALLTLMLYVGHLLFKAPPAWSAPEGFLYTVANQFNNGRLSPIHRQAIEVAAQTPGVKGHSWFSVKAEKMQLAGQPPQTVQVFFYAESFSQVFGLLELPTTKQGLWLSHRYWQAELGADPSIIGKTMTHRKFPAAIPVLGILPASLDRIGPFLPDLWLPEQFISYLTPFGPGSSEMLVQRFLMAAPNYFGVLLTSAPLSEQALTEHLLQQDLAVPGMRMIGDGATLVIRQGLDLDPPARQRLLHQWQLMLLVLLGFTLVLSLNTLALFTNRFIRQQTQFRTLRMLGAGRLDLLRGPLLLSAIMITIVWLMSAAWLFLLGELLQQSSLQTLTGNTSFQLPVGSWLAALLLVAVLLFGCACLPALRLSRQALFSRQIGYSISQSQKWLSQLNLAAQLWVALTASAFLMMLGTQQWQQFKGYSLDTSSQVLSVSQQGSGGMSFTALAQNNVANIPKGAVAFSSSSFDAKWTTALQDDRLAAELAILWHTVSGNYFSVLQVPLLFGAADWQQGVMINQTLAKLLNPTAPEKTIGSQINLGLAGPQPVVGIVADLPHHGNSQTTMPAAYLHVQSNPLLQSSAQQWEFYFANHQAAQIEKALKRWLSSQLQDAQFKPLTSLAAVISPYDLPAKQLLWSSAMLIFLVLLTVFISLTYQIRNKILLEQHEYGVLLAIGASDGHLLRRALRQTLVPLLFVLPLSFVLLSWMLAPTGWLAGFGLNFSSALLAFCGSCLLLLLMLAAALPVWWLVRQSVFPMLRQL